MPKTLTLGAAQQIANRIRNETAFQKEIESDDGYGYRRPRRQKVQTLTPIASINVDSPDDRVDQLRTDLIAKRDRMFKLMQIGTRVRTAITNIQGQKGITALVTERVEIVQRKSVLEALLASVERGVYNKSEFQSIVKATRGRLENQTQGTTAAHVETPLFTADDRDSMRRDLAATNRRLMEIDNRLAELKATNEIQIGDEDQQYLEQEGIA